MSSNLFLTGALLVALIAGRPAAADVVSDVHGLMAKGELTAALRAADAAVQANPRDAQ